MDGVETPFKDLGGSYYFSYTLNNIEADHTVLVAMRDYTITLPYIEGATIDVGPGEHAVAYGGSFTFTLTPVDNVDPENIHVYANDLVIEPERLEGNILRYTIDKITEAITIGIKGTNPTSNRDIADDSITITARNGKLRIDNYSGKTVNVTVYNLRGQMIAQCEVTGTDTIALSTGIYIVQAGGETYKVIVP